VSSGVLEDRIRECADLETASNCKEYFIKVYRFSWLQWRSWNK